MIFRLEYGNRFGDTTRIDITTPGLPTIVEVEGTGDPFRLKYTPDKSDKSFRFLTSSAEINIYETPDFNIDRLKTSSETDIKVDYYINSVKEWTGYVLPDFFSREIGGNAVVSMVASDRISTLKGVTLSDLPAMVSIRDLAVQCLAKTGLDLPLKTMVDFSAYESPAVGFNDYFRSEIPSQRLVDNKGRSISCYDVLNSILVTSNSFLEQRKGEWHIINKLQHELGEGELYSSPNTHTTYSEVTHNFSEITKGAIRTIIPVAASVGVFHEHGGGKMHPDNYDFSKDLTGWNPVGGFIASIDNRQITGYSVAGSGIYTPTYGEVTDKKYLVNNNEYRRNTNPMYLESDPIDIPYSGLGSIEVELDVNGIGPKVYPHATWKSVLRIAIVAVSDSGTLTLDHGGKFIPMPSTNPPVFEKEFDRGVVLPDLTAAFDTKSMKVKGVLEVGELSNYKIKVRIYGSGSGNTVIFNTANVVMKNSQEVPKGNLYKREQGSNYTKSHDIETSIFGDYITGGLNGYFYDYPIDDTSSLYIPSSGLRSKWIDPTDPNSEELPLLQHVVRQKARMFSVAHDKISGEIEMVNFDPLAIFVDCNGTRYSLVSAEVDFLRSNVKIEIEEIAYQNLTVRDFIYSYFGEGESNIKSVGGIASGSGGGTGGGGMTNDQIAILNDVAELAHSHENKEAIDQITQDMVDNASREMVVSTDTETELSDENYLSSLRTIKEITERSISKITEDEAQEVITFLKGIIAEGTSHFVNLIATGKITSVDMEAENVEVADTLTAKDIISDTLRTDIFYSLVRAELQDAILKGQLNSETFTSGFLGNGFRLNRIGENWVLELDEIIVRKSMQIYELIVQRVRYQGGQVIHSPAGGKITAVTNGGTYWRVEHDSPDDFITNDQVLCQNFKVGSAAQNPDGSTTFDGVSVKRYWRLVTSYGKGWFNLSKTDMEAGSANPEVGDDIVVLGNRTDPNRQNAYMIVSTGANSPYTAHVSGINSYSTEGKEKVREGNLSGIVDPDFGQLSGFGLYAQNVFLKGIFRLTNGQLITDFVEDRITLAVSDKVDKNQIVASINLSEEGVKIQGDKIQFTGSVSFSAATKGVMQDDIEGLQGDIQDAQQAASQADQKAQQALDEAANIVTDFNAEIATLQQQIDGEVSNWFYPYSPTLSNYPASDWTTNEIKDRHIGDTFTNTAQAPATDAGKSWRFVKTGSTYSWTLIADSDAVKALLKAAEAQATADGKSTTYLIQPTSYKLGDMWVLAADQTVNGVAYKAGEILTATQDSATYNQAHWVKKVRYTDDTAVDNLEIGRRNYVLNSNFLSGLDSTFDSSGGTRELIDGNAKYTVRGYDGTQVRLHSITVSNIPLGIYTFSIRARAEVKEGSFSNWVGANIISSESIAVSDEFALYTVKFEKTTNEDSNLTIRIYQSRTSQTSTEPAGVLWVDWYALVRGDKPMIDWTPAPEDVQAEIDAAVVKATYWSIKATSPVIYKDAINAATSGTHTPVTVSGELRSGTTTTSGGFITVTPNGGTEAGTASASPVTIAPANGDGKTSYTVRLYDTASKTTLLDTMTIPVVFKGASGVNAISAVLSNEADVLPASSEGVVSDYSGSGTDIIVYEGGTRLTYGTGNGQFQVSASGSGISVGSASTVSGNIRRYANASNMTSDNATITFTITGKTASGASFSLTKVQAFAKSKTGQKGDTGASAPLLYLSASAQVMKCNPDNTPQTGQTISIEAKLQNVSGTATFTAIPYNDAGTALTAITLGGSGNTRTLTNAQWLATYKRIEVVATLGSLNDKVTIYRVADGATGATGQNAIVGLLTNESVTLQANSAGAVSSFTPANGEFWVYNGTTKVTSGITFSKVSQTGCTAAITSAGVYSVSAMSADNATVLLRAVYGGVTIDKVLTLSKSRAGADGVSITLVDVEFAKNTSPTTAPTTGWTTTAPTLAEGEQLWTRTKTTYSSGSPTYSTPANITPKKGDTGAVGQGVESVTEEYAISTSKTTQPTTGWSTTQPTWSQGQYIWSRVKVVYKNPASTVYTGYAVSSEWEAVNNLEIGGVNLLPKSRGTELGNYANGGLYALGGYGISIYGGDSFMIVSSGVPDPPDNQNNIRIATGKTLQLNETYTLSFEARTTSDQDRDHNVRLPYLGNNIVSIKTGENFQKYSVTFKITNENTVNGSNNYFFFWQQNQGIYVTYLRRIKLEKGNKATDWSPAPEDVQAEIDAANAIAADAQAKANISKAITDKFGTTVDGGLISTVITEFREADSEQVTGLISGIQGANKDLPFLVAGGTYAEGIAGTAKAIIRHDGTSKFTDTEIEGKITATSGAIGGFTIASGRLGVAQSGDNPTNNGMSLYNEFIKFSNSQSSVFLGTNVLPGSSGTSAMMRLTNNYNDGYGKKYGAIISVSGNSSLDGSNSNIALSIHKGVIEGLRIQIKSINISGSSTVNLDNLTNIYSVYPSANGGTLVLPESPEAGTLIIIYVINSYSVLILGSSANLIKTGVGGNSVTVVGIGGSAGTYPGNKLFVYDGTYWLMMSI